MADFKKALAEGFVAAEKAEIARKEVEETLAKLKDDLLAASDGKLLVEVRQLEKREAVKSPATIFSPVDYGKLMAQAVGRKNYYKALIAMNPKSKNSAWYELAIWKRAKAGYPCSLIWGNQERQCE